MIDNDSKLRHNINDIPKLTDTKTGIVLKQRLLKDPSVKNVKEIRKIQ